MLGRLDPSTGEFKEYPVKVARSGPHGLVADKDGNIWFTASTKNFVGKVNPKTGEITQYAFPDPTADHPHTPVIDRNGDVLFTVMYGNMVGKVTVESGTGEIRQGAHAAFGSLRHGDGHQGHDVSSRSRPATNWPASIRKR